MYIYIYIGYNKNRVDVPQPGCRRVSIVGARARGELHRAPLQPGRASDTETEMGTIRRVYPSYLGLTRCIPLFGGLTLTPDPNPNLTTRVNPRLTPSSTPHLPTHIHTCILI